MKNIPEIAFGKKETPGVLEMASVFFRKNIECNQVKLRHSA
jgi:hypothetical protein